MSRSWMEWFAGMPHSAVKAAWPSGAASWVETSKVFRLLRHGDTTLSCCACRQLLECTTTEYTEAMLRYNAPHHCPRPYVTRP